MKTILSIAVILISTVASATDYEFKNFQIDKDAINKYRVQSVSESPSLAPSKKAQILNEKNVYSKSSLFGDQPINDLESPLMQEIRDYLGRDFSIIRDEQRQLLWERGKQFNLGVKNYNGLQWQQPMGQYTVYTDREVVPGPNNERWVVSDQLVIAIDAQTFLREMNENGIVDIGEAQLGAFAGLQFHRVYEYKYYVDSYDEGINGQFDKLLLGFLNFVEPRADLMYPNEVLTKTDFMGFYAGALADVPLKYGLELTAGVLVKAEKMSQVELRSLAESDIVATGEFLKVKTSNSKSTSVGAELGLKLDFFNILKLTLLSFEYHMEKTETESAHLSFGIDDRIHFTSSTPVSRALADLLHFKKLDQILYPYLDIKQYTSATTKTKNFRIFNWGNASSTESSQSRLLIPGEEDRFVVDHSTSDLKFTKGWKGALWDMTFQSSIGFDFFNDYKYSLKKTSSLEYERNYDGENSEGRMTQEFFAYKTHNKKKYRKRAIAFIEDFTYFGDELKALVKSGQLRGPMKIKVTMKVFPESFYYLDGFSKRDAEPLFEDICIKDDSRRLTTKAKRCISKLMRYFRKYKSADNIDDKIWKFKDLLSTVNKYSPSIDDLRKMFGAGGLYISGSFKSKTDNGLDFQSYFEKGSWGNKLSPKDNILYPKTLLGPETPLLD